LIVDDEHEVTDFLKEYLRDKGLAAATAENADEHSLFMIISSDIIVTDIKMPGKMHLAH